MASSSGRNPYQKLKNEVCLYEYDDGLYDLRGKARSSSRFRRVHIRKKLKIKIPWFRKLFSRKAKMVRFAWTKVLKRLKESQPHFGDLFAGNYLFMQVTPTSFKDLSKKSLKGVQDFHGIQSRTLGTMSPVLFKSK
ncbi:hypothetical protein LIER_05126 [Lithospermum erythrorhizon]|uniref:Uncharacterized protein n=1 Tax=Lithospermum erythrorhizon TaxID=34254 RepID=A0AAV3P3Z0_LITER